MKNLINEEIVAALEKLGVRGEISIRPPLDPLRIVVTLNGAYFGVWDVIRRTFVD
jgi:hypothetical protein